MLRTESAADALLEGLVEIEGFVGRAGWDQPARLFALVPTDELLAADPTLADHLTQSGGRQLSSIEQDDFRPGTDLLTALNQIGWPPAVAGCALVVERSFLPVDLEAEMPADPSRAAEFVANHPQRCDVRVVAGALRQPDEAPMTHCVARLATNPEELLIGADMVPALTQAVAYTLHEIEGTP